MITEIRLPELGESIKSADVVKLLITVGERIEKDQPFVELETDKASFEVPSPLSGTITEILVHEGGKAIVGDVIFKIESEIASETSATTSAEPTPLEEAVKTLSPVEQAPVAAVSRTSAAQPRTSPP